jgi:serine O-acetyltransferase
MLNIWNAIRSEAAFLADSEPLSRNLLNEQVLSRNSFAESLAYTLACQLAGEVVDRSQLEHLFLSSYQHDHHLVDSAIADLVATVERDAACHSYLEPLLFFKGYQSIQAYRVAHALWNRGNTFSAKMLQSIISRKFTVDIHPAAKIGHGLLVDHATNLVIGETARVGNNVSFLHGVTLGGTGKETGDRHPKIGDGVMIGAHAQLLGNIHIGKGAKIGAGAVVVTDVPAHTTYAGVPAVKVGRPGEDMPALDMQQDFTCDTGTAEKRKSQSV